MVTEHDYWSPHGMDRLNEQKAADAAAKQSDEQSATQALPASDPVVDPDCPEVQPERTESQAQEMPKPAAQPAADSATLPDEQRLQQQEQAPAACAEQPDSQPAQQRQHIQEGAPSAPQPDQQPALQQPAVARAAQVAPEAPLSAQGQAGAHHAGFQAPVQPPYQGQAQASHQAPAQAQPPFQAQAQTQPPYQAQAQAQPQFQAQPSYQAQAPYQAPPQPAYAQAPYQAAYQVPGQMPASNKSHGWIVALVLIVCLFAFTAFCVNACTSAVSSLQLGSYGSAGYSDITEDTIGVIDLNGTIQYDGSACSPEGLKELLDEAESNSFIKAVVLRVDSGGGVATAGEEMAQYLRDFSKPVVVSSASLNASAAYEISAQADYIFVAKSTEIGGIGTAMQMSDLSGLLEKLGISMETIASAESKDSSYGYRPLTDEEREYYQRMVDQINDMFIENVAEGRKMDVKDVRKLATGLVFTGVDAVENGLADAIGTREDALDKAAELAHITDYEVTDLYFPDYGFSNLAYLLGESRVSTDDIINALKDLNTSQVK